MIFNMNFELRNELANFRTKFGIFWQKFCEIDCNCTTDNGNYSLRHFLIIALLHSPEIKPCTFKDHRRNTQDQYLPVDVFD